MSAISKEQIKSIYALGTKLGIKGSGRDDELHALVYGITGKESVKALTSKEFYEVERELNDRIKREVSKEPEKKKSPAISYGQIGHNGMATPEQQRLCWRYCYRLKELDPDPNSAQAVDRLIGAIKKVCKTNMVTKKEPFRCIDQEACSKLIEQLKRYVKTAERQAKIRGGENAAGGS